MLQTEQTERKKAEPAKRASAMNGTHHAFRAYPPRRRLCKHSATPSTSETVRRLPESHPRQWVDCSDTAYTGRPIDRFFESHPREWVDRSSPAYKESRRRPLFLSSLCRPQLNDSPTAVRGISAACISRSVLGVVPRLSPALNSLREEVRLQRRFAKCHTKVP